MSKKINRIIAGTLSAMFVGQVLIFGDGNSQGILHADTIASAKEAIEEAKNAKQLQKEFDSAIREIGDIDFFSIPEINTMSLEQEETSESEITYAKELTITGFVEKGIVEGFNYVNDEKIYVRIYDGAWGQLAYKEVDSDGYYEVSASGSDVYHVKFECNGFLPFYLKDFGTGTFVVGSGDSEDTVTLVPGDTTYNEETNNSWSDDNLNVNDVAYVQNCYGATRNHSDFNLSMDMDNDGAISESELNEFCELYLQLEEDTYYDVADYYIYDTNDNGVINMYDYMLLYNYIYNDENNEIVNVPDLTGDGYFDENDLDIFGDLIYSDDAWFYNHDMDNDGDVDSEDYIPSVLNAYAQIQDSSDSYYSYMDINSDGIINDYDIAWFEESYIISGNLYWDNAFKRSLTLLENGEFPYSLNLHDTNLNLNGCALHIKDCMSFTTDMPKFWDNGEGAILDVNYGYLKIDNNLVFRTTSPDGWGCDTGQLLNINNGIVEVGKCFDFGQDKCYDIILMVNDDDLLIVNGNWTYKTLANMEGKWTAGQICFFGQHWNVNENSGNKAIFSSDNHSIVFYYPYGKQTILWCNRSDEIGEMVTDRTFNFYNPDGLIFPYGYSPEMYWFRPWFPNEKMDVDYTLYRKGWEIGDGVHIASGNYTKSFTDLSVTSPGVTSDFVRTYNSTSTEEGSFGLGWDFNIDVSKIISPASGYYQVILPDGSNTTFKETANGVFECLNAHSTMVKNGNEYTITNSVQSQYHFNAGGELDCVRDANGNELTISPKINNQRTVTDSTKRTYTIQYKYINGKNRIEYIKDDLGDRTVIYNYNDNAQLISATNVLGGTEYYEYNDNGRLCKIINCYSEVTDEINYYNDNTVNWLTNSAGLKQVYTYDKPQHQTGLKEYDGDNLVKSFNYEYDEKYAVKTNIVETDNQTYNVDKITYRMVDGENKYDEMIENIDIMGNTTKYDRDDSGNIIKTINPDGTYSLARYNNKNMPVVQVDESKNVIIYEYDELGINLLKQYQSFAPISNADSIASGGYDLAQVSYADYAMTQYTYYPASETSGIIGLIRTITDPEGNVTEYTYGTTGYAKGLPIKKVVKDGDTAVNIVEYEYNAQLQVSKEKTSVDILNNVYTVKEYEYDKFNNITKVSDYGTGTTAAVTIIEYDKLGRKTAEYSPKYSSNKEYGTFYTYYPSDAIATQTDALGNVLAFEYNAYGDTIKQTNPDGTINLVEYDGLQREKGTYFKTNDSGIQQVLTTTGYEFETYTASEIENTNPCNGLRTIKTIYISAENQVVTDSMTDFRGNVIEERINEKIKRTCAYYANGQLASQTDALGNTITHEYNFLNMLTKISTPFNAENYSVTENQYDKNGNLILSKQTVQKENSSDVEYSITQNEYNALGLLTQVTLKGTGSSKKNISKYFYNDAGIQTKMYTGLSSEDDTTYLTTEYTYDNWLRLVRTIDSTGYNSGTVTYDLNSNILTIIDANGNTTTNTYDALDRVLTSNTINPDDSFKNNSKSYFYDNMGRVTKTINNDITTTYAYDTMGRKYSETEYTADGSYNVFRGYFYEGVSQYVENEITGQYHTLMYSNKIYEYDDEMRIVKVKESGNETVSYTYDANGNKKTETLENGVVSNYTYNNANKITKIENKSGNTDISSYEYSYYLDGSDACKVRNESGIIETTEYEYDSLKRLVEESRKVGGNTTDTFTYEYDDYGNRSKMTATGTEDYTTIYSYIDSNGDYTALLQNEVKTTQSESNTLNSNNSSNVKQTVYTYDANGNQITKTADGKTETNTYDGLNQLIGFTDGETVANYAYNVNGLRYEKTVNGKTINHVWDGSRQIVADVVENQFYEADCYIRGTNLVAKYNFLNGAKSEYIYYTQNAHGDVVNLTDADGNVTKSYTYDAFGVEKNIDDSDTNAFRYCGEYYDAETGTIYLRARYYNPTIGRFISRDSYTGKIEDPLSLNFYTYCHNNPVQYVDENGHWPKLSTILTAVAVVAATVAVVAVVVAAAPVAAAAITAVSSVATASGTIAISTAGVATASISVAASSSVVATATTVAAYASATALTAKATAYGVKQIENSFSNTSKNVVYASKNDPYARPNQKKQGRERKEKKKSDGKKWRGNPNKRIQPPKKHTPGRDHRKYKP